MNHLHMNSIVSLDASIIASLYVHVK
jgi:hypothetical protein